jgi:hypothetical protein
VALLQHLRGTVYGQHERSSEERRWIAPTCTLVAVVLLASWMGYAKGGYFISDWACVALILAALMLVNSLAGALSIARSRWTLAATGFFALYTSWTFLSLLWSPNRGAAWLGAAQTLLYLLVFWIAAGLIALGASRRWVLLASAVGPATVAFYTLIELVPRIEELFDNGRLLGNVGYFNGEAAFLLVPFWVAIYLAGSRRLNVLVRGLVLAGIVLSVDLAVLTQSRGAMLAMAASLPVFFLFSGQRLRGLLALAPVLVVLFVSFPGLNDVYLESWHRGDPTPALRRMIPIVWLTIAGAGLYGLCWGLVDRWWRPPTSLVRVVGGIVVTCSIIILLCGAAIANQRVGGDPITWSEQKWQAFETNDKTGIEQSRYLSAGSGRYTLWQVAWEDFTSHPLLGVGTHNYEATYYQRRDEPGPVVHQPHSLVLEVLAERGVVGGALLLGFLTTCLAAGLRQRFKYLDAEGKGLVGAMVASVAYWFIHSSAEWFWQIPAVTLPAVLYLAALAAPWGTNESNPFWPLRLGGVVVAALAVLAVAPLYIADRNLAQSYATTNPRVALAAVVRAQKFNSVDPDLPQREAELATQIRDWSRAKDAYHRSIRLNPEHFAPYELMASFYERRGESEKALSLYRKALALNPFDKKLHREVVQLTAGTTHGGSVEDAHP